MKTKIFPVRIGDEVKKAARAEAESRGYSLSSIIRVLLIKFIKNPDKMLSGKH
jgi:antitoxin component of RelBE/YafQ-DinJ toxin-antitoxin module